MWNVLQLKTPRNSPAVERVGLIICQSKRDYTQVTRGGARGIPVKGSQKGLIIGLCWVIWGEGSRKLGFALDWMLWCCQEEGNPMLGHLNKSCLEDVQMKARRQSSLYRSSPSPFTRGKVDVRPFVWLPASSVLRRDDIVTLLSFWPLTFTGWPCLMMCCAVV